MPRESGASSFCNNTGTLAFAGDDTEIMSPITRALPHRSRNAEPFDSVRSDH
jgi:hypothetical protein